ncbi:CHAT domain-containing protein [Suillus occidentalis]|nr:CHAT domain-containing protein [Suillus occidentalis]
MPVEPDCSSKLETAGRNRELQAYLLTEPQALSGVHKMALDDIESNEDDQDRLFTEYTINTVHASYAAAQSRVRQYTQLLALLRREEDEWARKVEKANNILPHYKPNLHDRATLTNQDYRALATVCLSAGLWKPQRRSCLRAPTLYRRCRIDPFVAVCYPYFVPYTLRLMPMVRHPDPALSIGFEAVSRNDLTAAKSWATSAEKTNHGSALVAYQTVKIPRSACHSFVVFVTSFRCHAFSCSIRHDALTTAVEMVEQGRAVFWTHLARFRTTLDELSMARHTGAALAEEFKQLSFRLRSTFDQSTEDQFQQIRQLTMQWNDVVSCICMLPDFSRFLRPPLFSDLQKAAEEGPVIIVNASQLWHDIVDPVVQALGASNVHPGSRIWWCPTAEFTLLPLHAAGAYEKKRDNLPHIYISSYTPTLAALVRSPDGDKPVQCVASELTVVAQRLTPVVSSFTSLEDSDATVEGAFDAVNHNQWLHLACHGKPNKQKPFESSFATRDGPLMIKDIIRSNWRNSEFAFLSACHTTIGDEKSPDESIHLAAAMQFRSVIGSMWSVDDEVAQEVVSAFYGNLVGGSGRLDCTRTAMALHKAVKKLQRNNVPLEQQIVFVQSCLWDGAGPLSLLALIHRFLQNVSHEQLSPSESDMVEGTVDVEVYQKDRCLAREVQDKEERRRAERGEGGIIPMK